MRVKTLIILTVADSSQAHGQNLLPRRVLWLYAKMTKFVAFNSYI